ncbi:MAG: PHP domain-containing protein [Desulfonauticus sp.]|nr:PHP domain-containing protein [Desulfonauticus sp.]
MSEIDLHTHSTASDGTLSPTELVALAKKLGLKAIALTDHDTLAGLEEALKAGEEFGIEVIPGCELSVHFKGITHILGLWLKPDALALEQAFRYLHQKRAERNILIVEKLQKLGFAITYEEVEAKAKGTVGRPHIAQVLVEKGLVSSLEQAFCEYLGPRGKAFVPKEKFTPEKAIQILKQEGATVILAHPISLGLEGEELKKDIMRLKEWGVEGIEVFYSEYTSEQTQFFVRLARELHLLASGGSDFHGQNKPHIQLGKGLGNLHLPYSLLENLKANRAKQGLWV